MTITTITRNIVQFLRDNSSLTIIDTAYDPSDSSESIIVRSTGGSSRQYPDNRQDESIQILSRAESEYTAGVNAYTIFNLLRNNGEHGVTFTAANLTGELDILIDRVDMLQRPFSIGAEGNYFLYSFNAVFTYFAA